MSDILKGLNVFLIGMMGAGKTSVGRILAKQLGYRFFDTDAVVEQATGQSITDLFTSVGESGFRDVETQVLSELSTYTRLVVATGGGIVLRQMNWSYLRHGMIVWLDVPVEQLYHRLQADRSRPLLQEGDLATRLQRLSEERRLLYAQADIHIVQHADESPDQVAQRIIEQIPAMIKPRTAPPIGEDN